MRLSDFNSADANTAVLTMLECCGSHAWASGMVARRPFTDRIHLHVSAEEVWQALPEADWLEAFTKHPKIGESSNLVWAALEQSGMNTAAKETAAAMRELNRQYENRFGFIFITCASGKSAEEMHRELVERLSNERTEEIRIAAVEQRDITALRLRKLFG
jgi:OHCU decarboxylase